MSKLQPFEDKDLGIVYIEVVETPNASNEVTRGGATKLGANATQKVTKSLDEAIDSVGKLAAKITKSIVNNPLFPDEIECKIGIKFTAEAGIVIANLSSEGSLELTLKWNSKQLADREKQA